MLYPGQESSMLEFKASLPRNNQIVKTIIGFCNHHGGKVILGVEDKGLIVGLPDDEIEYILDHLDKKIYESSSPPIIPKIHTQTLGEKTIVIIEVSSGMNKPYYLTSEGIEKGTYIRLGRNTMRATPDIIEELRWSSQGLSYDARPVFHATPDDLDMAKIENFLQDRKGSEDHSLSVHDALKAYNLITQIHAHTYPTVGGMLLFGKDPQRFLSEAFIICSRFAGIEGREALATRDCLGTLMEQYRDAYNFVLSKLDRSFTIKGPVRSEQYEIPEQAVREAIINAIMHRSYSIRSPIKIAIYDNRIEIFSPGGFPGPLHEENFQMGFTYIRNTIISKVLREAGLSEKMGTGLKLIYSQYAKRSLEKPQIFEAGNFVKYILPRPSMSRVLELKVDDEDFSQILMLFEKANELTSIDIAESLNMSRSTVLRRLSNLINRGLIKKIGKKRGARYIRIR